MKLKLIHFNTQGVANEARLQELEYALGKIEYDIVGISETKREGEKIIKTSNGNIWFYFGCTKGYRGVGFYINKKVTNKISEMKGISERIAFLKVQINKKTKLLIIQVYAPTLEAPKDEIKEFYNTLENTLMKEQERYNIIMGDFNAKIGNDQTLSGCTGPHTLNDTNRNGQRLGKFCMKHNLKIANTYFNEDKTDKWTWKSPNGKTKNEIDHLITNDIRTITNYKVVPDLAFSSDHRPAISNVSIPIGPQVAPTPLQNAKGNISNLWIPVHKQEEAKANLKNKLEEVNWGNSLSDNLDSAYEKFLKIIVDTLTLFGIDKKHIKTDDKLCSETKGLIERRKVLRDKVCLSIHDQIELVELKKLIKRKIREDIRNFEEAVMTEIIEETWSTRKTKKVLTGGQCLSLIHISEPTRPY